MSEKSGDLQDDRKDYTQSELHRDSLKSDPLSMFNDWMTQARDAQIIDATAMTLATIGANGMPSARIVLLKQFGENGFYWYTNYQSRKGTEIAHNPNAALVFFWREMERQIRIEGTVSKATSAESDAYFNKRPIESRFSATASPQSQVIESQQWLTEHTNKLREKYSEETLVRPDNWGGYKLQPSVYEFWQGRPSRQHDRFRYTRNESNKWQTDRLAP